MDTAGAQANQPHEAGLLKLDVSKAASQLGWRGTWDVQRTVEGSSLQTICHMVAQGLGITVLPASCVPYLRSNVNSIKTIPFKSPSPSRRVIMVWRKSFTRMSAIETLAQAVKSTTLNGCFYLDEPPVAD